MVGSKRHNVVIGPEMYEYTASMECGVGCTP
jgi:hypothetical protein